MTLFTKAHPKPVDIPQKDYERDREQIDAAAAQHGYRLAGIRQGRAVFTTKAPK